MEEKTKEATTKRKCESETKLQRRSSIAQSSLLRLSNNSPVSTISNLSNSLDFLQTN
ncbi:hypothetical protein Csa_012705 [Cucumis sativus]|uniref:Uncharacterized protein n=1 Tax=Cucumis sativus TaxID=3659 RepID=A0A0A0L0M8_CUCSA|nr:hypothetical protein Csa_012705 [Cucumis sativus]